MSPEYIYIVKGCLLLAILAIVGVAGVGAWCLGYDSEERQQFVVTLIAFGVMVGLAVVFTSLGLL